MTFQLLRFRIGFVLPVLSTDVEQNRWLICLAKNHHSSGYPASCVVPSPIVCVKEDAGTGKARKAKNGMSEKGGEDFGEK